jgi:hypothetical protein
MTSSEHSRQCHWKVLGKTGVCFRTIGSEIPPSFSNGAVQDRMASVAIFYMLLLEGKKMCN